MSILYLSGLQTVRISTARRLRPSHARGRTDQRQPPPAHGGRLRDPQVLALSYTAHDLAPFARDLGYVDEAGQVLPPFVWNPEERRARLAALDAVFFWLYGLDASDAAYIQDTFPIVRDQDIKAFGRYRTQDDILQLLSLLTPSP